MRGSNADRMNSDRTASTNVVRAMRMIRRKRGISVLKLSDLLAVEGQLLSRTVLTNQETGRGRTSGAITIDQVLALTRVLDVPLEVLLNPVCESCGSLPPVGFTCNDCGATTASVSVSS